MVDEDTVRRLALSLPETSERSSYGTPGFRVRDKLFARIRPEGDRLALWCWDESEKEALLASDDRYTTIEHYDGYPMLLVRLDAADDDFVLDALTESWRVRAPRRLRAEFDAESAED